MKAEGPRYLVRQREGHESTQLEKILWRGGSGDEFDDDTDDQSIGAGDNETGSVSMETTEQRQFSDDYWTNSPSEERAMEDLTVSGEVLRDLMDDVAESDPYINNNVQTDMEEEAEADIEEEDATEPEPAPNKKRGRPKGLSSSKKASKTAAAANPARASTDDRNPD